MHVSVEIGIIHTFDGKCLGFENTTKISTYRVAIVTIALSLSLWLLIDHVARRSHNQCMEWNTVDGRKQRWRDSVNICDNSALSNLSEAAANWLPGIFDVTFQRAQQSTRPAQPAAALCGGYNYDSTSIRQPLDGRSTAYQRSVRSQWSSRSQADSVIYLVRSTAAQTGRPTVVT